MNVLKHFTLVALTLSLAIPASHVVADPSWPESVAAAKAQLYGDRRRPSFKIPPTNVRAEDYRGLFGDTVMVVARNIDGTGRSMPRYGLKFVFIGRDGRYVWCNTRPDGKYRTSDINWRAAKVRIGKHVIPVLDDYEVEPNTAGLVPFYDGATGDAIWYIKWRGRWWDHDIGHHQERLPASTWTLCPDFPSAKELGVGINQKQTALTYDKLIAQDPGRRIRRPDLVTPNAVEKVE